MLLEEVVEMGGFPEAEGEGYFGNIEVGVAQQGFGFLKEAFGDHLGGGLFGHFLHQILRVAA